MMTIKTFFANESGATASEYALLVATRLSAEFSEISGALK